MRGFWRSLVSDDQLRWLGPEKGVIHLATAAVVNAVWDLWAKSEGKPLWKLLVDMSPEQLVACDRLPLHRRTRSRPTRRSTSCARRARERGARAARSSPSGYPAYTTSAGWLGYDDDKVASARPRGASPPASRT